MALLTPKMSDFAKNETINWLEKQRYDGAFKDFPEEVMDFRKLNELDLTYYFLEWLAPDLDRDNPDNVLLLNEYQKLLSPIIDSNHRSQLKKIVQGDLTDVRLGWQNELVNELQHQNITRSYGFVEHDLGNEWYVFFLSNCHTPLVVKDNTPGNRLLQMIKKFEDLPNLSFLAPSDVFESVG